MNSDPKARLRWLLLAALFHTLPASANVIFPAFAAPYVLTALSPVLILAVIVIETAVLFYRERQLGLGGAFFLISLANGVSWVVGVVLAVTLFPSGLGEGAQAGPGPAFGRLLWIAFPVALVLSILIEAAVLRLLSRWIAMRAPLTTMAVANAASYLILVATLAWR